MIFSKAGECLRYALGRELLNKDTDGKEPNHLNAFLSYFTLIRKIDGRAFLKVRIEQKMKEHMSESFERFYRNITGIISADLKKHYSFSDADSMFSTLDEIEIPEWVFKKADELVDFLPGLYYVDDYLYYIAERNDGYYFRCVPVWSSEALNEFSEDATQEVGRTISNIYSEIIGYDEQRKVFYLRLRHSGNVYAEYYVDEKQELLHNHRCLGVLGNSFPIIVNENDLSVVTANKIKKIKSYNISEQYNVEENYIDVKPSPSGKNYFKPYICFLQALFAEKCKKFL